MRRTRALWLSILFVVALVGASVTAFALGTRPILGLDLEGGVSVILSAPDGTDSDVMDQALANIRNRVDAFGTSEPILFVSGTNIEVQIPGLARGTIEERTGDQWCLLDEDGTSYGCFDEELAARDLIGGATVEPVVQRVCLAGGPYEEDEEAVSCFGTEGEADQAIAAMQVRRQEGQSCLRGTGLEPDPCFETREEAEAELAAIEKDVVNSYCVRGSDGQNLASDVGGAACYPTEQDAETTLAEIEAARIDRQFCVVSSAGRDLGCFFDREDARARLQETGQERLLQVIGETARLEFREVRETLTPGVPNYEATPVDCATPEAADSPECSFEALQDHEVVFLAEDGETKYRLGPVELTGDAITRAAAVFAQQQVGQGWQIDFNLNSQGAAAFGEVTTRLAPTGGQLGIVVDRSVISAPTVQDPITGGSAFITGSFTENRARDLATQLNAGALPVELTTEQVVTVSPTLGRESLDQGILAGVGGWILLALYLLYYYRILALVAWLGMAMWTVLALGLVALAGSAIGYSLTLAGVAGLVISLGVTADSYIVFFERFKDEIHGGKTPRAAVQPAFKRAFRTIVAGDIVTILAAAVLYLTAVSSVRGFALTLGVAVTLDLFIVYFFKRPAVYLLARSERLVTMRGVGVTSGVALEREPAPAVAGGSK
ncbi:MAG TPA: protein translocase subunit SecD [Actinomycetota bacterium]|nr:protein translocase subunit SecD [Actinomycetota bacterium]